MGDEAPLDVAMLGVELGCYGSVADCTTSFATEVPSFVMLWHHNYNHMINNNLIADIRCVLIFTKYKNNRTNVHTSYGGPALNLSIAKSLLSSSGVCN